MNSAHLHLIVNHVSLFAVLFGVIALGWAWLRNSTEMRVAAVGLFVVAGLFAWIATTSGEGAEEMVEDLPGVSESLIESHEDAAKVSNALIIVMAISGLLMEVIARKRQNLFKPAQAVVMISALLSVASLVQTASLGGQIRHTEIRSGAPVSGESGGESRDDNSGD